MVFGFLKSSYQRVTKALRQAGSQLGSRLTNLFKGKIDEEVLDQLEEILYQADLGVKTTTELVDRVRELHAHNSDVTAEELIREMKSHLAKQLSDKGSLTTGHPHVIFIVGVNGNGKTTSVAKIAHSYKAVGKKVLLGAADTFRAAAMDQLEMWANRVGADIVKGQPQADPAAVVFDAVSAGVAREADVVLIDTAGRLHTKTDLMKELEKMRRSASKVLPGAPHETLLVLDATTGQNAVDQATTFHAHTPLTGVILTKLDGTAKGGIVIAIQRELKIPVRYIGIGEGMEDLQPFEPDHFLEALFES